VLDILPCLCEVVQIWLVHNVTCTPIARQRVGRHVPTEAHARNNRTSNARQRSCKHKSLTIEDGVSVESVQRSYLKDNRCYRFRDTRVEAGSNTFTVTLQVVGGDEKGSLKSETVKYGRESQGTWTGERLLWQGHQHMQKTDPSSRQRGCPQKQDRNCQAVMKISGHEPQMGLDTKTYWLTDWLTVCHNVTLTLTTGSVSQ
jgi:hypothetical protein